MDFLRHSLLREILRLFIIWSCCDFVFYIITTPIILYSHAFLTQSRILSYNYKPNHWQYRCKKLAIPTYVSVSAKPNPEEDPSTDDIDDYQSKSPFKKNNTQQNNAQSKSKNSSKTKSPPKNSNNILSLLSNPFNAGKTFRKSIDSALNTLGTGIVSPDRRSIYYLDDRFLETSSLSSSSLDVSTNALAFAEKNPLLDRLLGDEFVPEVLVVGATGEIGRLVVQRLLLDGRFRVRVLVRDLYSKTLNMLGTGVTYCQGDLSNIESLEYAVTDVDKIVFCAGPPRRDEDDFKNKFKEFMNENLSQDMNNNGNDDINEIPNEFKYNDESLDLQKLSDIITVRAHLSEQIDCIGMQNLVRAYQNVRHADYGTSQAAKRSLFKFQDREEDFGLFSIDVDDFDNDSNKNVTLPNLSNSYDNGDNQEGSNKARSKSPSMGMKPQVNWLKNKFKHAVFVGRVPTSSFKGSGGGTSVGIVSSRLRSREDPDKGIDLSNGFSGFVCRICSDGKNYEAFIRTSLYETNGIEYVCKFSTGSKPSQNGNKSINKFSTVRLPFSKFVPNSRGKVNVTTTNDLESKSRDNKKTNDILTKPLFKATDVRHIGFRFQSSDNTEVILSSKKQFTKWMNFYLALSYIKVYRSQPEPEFVYLSDANIPNYVHPKMVRHNIKQIVASNPSLSSSSNDDGTSGLDNSGNTIFDEKVVKKVISNPKDRSGEEVYFKYRGEQILKHSGLSYTIVRIGELNELPSGDFNAIQLEQQSTTDLIAVSRAEVADVCVKALLDPNASNLSFYMNKVKPGKGSDRNNMMNMDKNIAYQFSKLEADL